MSSSNPFRQKGSRPEDRFPALDSIETTARPFLKTAFRSQSDTIISTGELKATKHVRILSPPPLSPSSPEELSHQPLQPHLHSTSQDYAMNNVGHQDDITRKGALSQQSWAPQASDNAPSTTWQNLEEERKTEGDVLKAANATKTSLNVDAFKRLLLTGNAGLTPESPTQSPAGVHDTWASNQPQTVEDNDRRTTTMASQQSAADKSERVPKEDGTIRNSTEQKLSPPPPPNSRHGRALRLDAHDSASNTSSPRPQSPAGLSRQAEGTPGRRSLEDERDPTNRLSVSGTPKKPVPVPPPRRGYGRNESKASHLATSNHAELEVSNVVLASSPLDQGRYAGSPPAPPPPRRQTVSGSPDSASPSPTVSTFNLAPSTLMTPPVLSPKTRSDSIESRDAFPAGNKQIAPPPPPSRNSSTRRPPSISSIDSSSRRFSGEMRSREGLIPPPPPPSRHKGGGSSSSISSTGHISIGSEARDTSTTPAIDAGGGKDVLADLLALQKEVENAMRGGR